MSQIDIWLSILVRKLISRGGFVSTDNLNAKVLAFVEHFNSTMAKPLH